MRSDESLFDAPHDWWVKFQRLASEESSPLSEAFVERVIASPSPEEYLSEQIVRLSLQLREAFGFEYAASNLTPNNIPLTVTHSRSAHCLIAALLFNLRLREVALEIVRSTPTGAMREELRATCARFNMAFPIFLACTLCLIDGPGYADRALAGWLASRIGKIHSRLETRLQESIGDSDGVTTGELRDRLPYEIALVLDETLGRVTRGGGNPFDPMTLSSLHNKVEYDLAPGGGSGRLRQERFEGEAVSLHDIMEPSALVGDGSESPESAVIRAESRLALMNALVALYASLTPGQREVFDAEKTLVQAGQKPTEATLSEMTGKARGTISSHRTRIRESAKKILGKYSPDS